MAVLFLPQIRKTDCINKLARKVVSINAKIRINQERGTSRQREYVAKL